MYMNPNAPQSLPKRTEIIDRVTVLESQAGFSNGFRGHAEKN